MSESEGPIELLRRDGMQLVIPSSLSMEDTVAFMQHMIAKERQDKMHVHVRHTLNMYPLEGAYSLLEVLKQRYGFVNLQQAFLGPPPTLVGVNIGDVSAQVVWGTMRFPGIDGEISTGFEILPDKTFSFVINAYVARRNEDEVKAIVAAVEAYQKKNSLLKGKAFKVTFPDDEDDEVMTSPMYMPKVMDLSQVHPEELIFPKNIEDLIRTSVLVPIQFTQQCRDSKIPLKRGVLLEGPFGVGKTLTAYVTAKIAVDNGWTFIYVSSAADISKALGLARQYQPCVVFAEDIDKAAEGNYRSDEVNEVLNTFDGVDTKDTEILAILTTNRVGAINQALLRPGRFDAIIPLRAPDADAAERLIQLYTRGMLVKGERLDKVGAILDGQIPSIIREAAERAKLAAIGNTKSGHTVELREEDLLVAARGMAAQIALLAPPKVDGRSDEEKAAAVLGDRLIDAVTMLLSHKAAGGNGVHPGVTTAEVPALSEATNA